MMLAINSFTERRVPSQSLGWLIFSVLSIIINERNKRKNVIMKKESKIFSRQFVTTESKKYGLRKKTFQWLSFVNTEKI